VLRESKSQAVAPKLSLSATILPANGHFRPSFDLKLPPPVFDAHRKISRVRPPVSRCDRKSSLNVSRYACPERDNMRIAQRFNRWVSCQMRRMSPVRTAESITALQPSLQDFAISDDLHPAINRWANVARPLRDLTARKEKVLLLVNVPIDRGSQGVALEISFSGTIRPQTATSYPRSATGKETAHSVDAHLQDQSRWRPASAEPTVD
jgi:hypothetical protein